MSTTHHTKLPYIMDDDGITNGVDDNTTHCTTLQTTIELQKESTTTQPITLHYGCEETICHTFPLQLS